MMIAVVIATLLLVPAVTYAHCPLCTIGAGAAALGASWLGVGGGAIGILLGAFALAIGLWVNKLIPRQFIPRQDLALGVVSFFTTLLPLQETIGATGSFYLSVAGSYGDILNRTYYVDTFLLGGLVGAGIVLAAPFLSRWISTKRGTTLPYQGVIITFILLFVTALIFEII